MKKIIFLFVIFSGPFLTLEAQESNTYKYVQVPEKFDSFDEKNEYELNALAAFLFEKYGFKVFYKEPIPGNIRPCGVLRAGVENNSGWFNSKLQVTLQDCRQEVIFTSEEGKSREKEYKISYQLALRDAFESLENFDVSPAVAGLGAAKFTNTEEEDIMATEEKVQEHIAFEKDPLKSGITEEERRFGNGGQTYILIKNASGFALFKEGQEEKFATLLKSGGGDNYIYSSENLRGNAYFEASGDLVVEYLDSNTEQLVSVKYQLQD